MTWAVAKHAAPPDPPGWDRAAWGSPAGHQFEPDWQRAWCLAYRLVRWAGLQGPLEFPLTIDRLERLRMDEPGHPLPRRLLTRDLRDRPIDDLRRGWRLGPARPDDWQDWLRAQPIAVLEQMIGHQGFDGAREQFRAECQAIQDGEPAADLPPSSVTPPDEPMTVPADDHPRRKLAGEALVAEQQMVDKAVAELKNHGIDPPGVHDIAEELVKLEGSGSVDGLELKRRTEAKRRFLDYYPEVLEHVTVRRNRPRVRRETRASETPKPASETPKVVPEIAPNLR
jgi:hypothetical protein